MSDPILTEKRCCKCKETKPIDAFSRNNQAKDGRQNQCKACNAAYRIANIDRRRAYAQSYNAANTERNRSNKADYYANNADKFRKRNLAYYAANRDEIRQKGATYRTSNADKVRERDTNYRAANADKIRERHAAYYAANLDKARESRRAYYANNRDKIRKTAKANRSANRIARRAAWHRRNARIKGNGGEGFSTQQLRDLHAAQNGFCAYCRFPWIAPLQIDHVIPIKQGGPHEAANIVLACADCNLEKRARTPDQWTNRWYQRLPPWPHQNKGRDGG